MVLEDISRFESRLEEKIVRRFSKRARIYCPCCKKYEQAKFIGVSRDIRGHLIGYYNCEFCNDTVSKRRY